MGARAPGASVTGGRQDPGFRLPSSQLCTAAATALGHRILECATRIRDPNGNRNLEGADVCPQSEGGSLSPMETEVPSSSGLRSGLRQPEVGAPSTAVGGARRRGPGPRRK